jgi:tetratricopeptide (TPR) repeat protein
MNSMTSAISSEQHVWITGPSEDHRRYTAEGLGLRGERVAVSAHRRVRGPYTAAGTILREIIPPLIAEHRELVQRHDVEILTAAPELDGLVVNRRATLTSMATPDERTRFYPRAHTRRIAHGLCELLLAWARLRNERPTVFLDRVDAADATDREFLEIMRRRCDPRVLKLIVGARSGVALALTLEQALQRYSQHLEAPSPARGHASEAGTRATTAALAQAYVDGDCTGERDAEEAAYRSLADEARAALHDRRAEQLEAAGEFTLRLGALPFHREHGSDPTGVGFASLAAAIEHCVLTGFYDAVLDLGERAKELIDSANRPEEAWLITAKVVTALTALGRPDEAEQEYDSACAASTLPSAHLQAAYGRAMLYTRFFDDRRQDHQKAKAWINTAIAIASMLPEPEWRTFNLTLNENGLALIEMHLGDLEQSLTLIESGLDRLRQALPDDRQTLHRSVLRYNRAQLLARLGRTSEALEAYNDLIGIDPNHSEYRAERAAVLRKLGRTGEAVADLSAAISLSPPYPEPYYNRGDILLELGENERAADDFAYVLELDPGFADAYINLASALWELGNGDRAAEVVSTGLDAAPDDPHLHSLNALILHHIGRLEQSEDAYAAALHLDPALGAAWANRAALAFDRGQLTAASHHLDRAIDLLGPLPDLLANRAVVNDRRSRAPRTAQTDVDLGQASA